MKVNLKVIPNSKRPEIKREKEYFKIKVDAPAKEGKANKRLLELLSDYFSLPKSRIKIIKGENSRNKVVEILK